MTDIYRQGSDIVLVETLYDQNGDEIPLASLVGYGLELKRGGTLLGKFGFNLTGFDDQYWEATGASELTFYLPYTLFTKDGAHYGRILINYTSANFPDSLRDLYSNRVNVFNIKT